MLVIPFLLSMAKSDTTVIHVLLLRSNMGSKAWFGVRPLRLDGLHFVKKWNFSFTTALPYNHDRHAPGHKQNTKRHEVPRMIVRRCGFPAYLR